MIYKIFNRVIACLTLVAVLFAALPVAFANAAKYPAYEFVITSDKMSVEAGDVLTITVTTNGPLANASMVQYQIVFNPQQFKTTTVRKTALDSAWLSEITEGVDFGAISTKPQIGLNPKPEDLLSSATQQIFTLVFLDSAVSGEIEETGESYSLFVPTSNTGDTAVAGKILFTALTDIEDVSNCFTVINAKNEYGNEKGTLKDNLAGTIVQLSETMAISKVTALIDAIGSPVTYSSKAAIEAARSAYEAITSDAVKAKITNIGTLIAAEAALKAITDEIARVKGLIDALDSTSDTFEADITKAEQAYNALKEDEKAALPGYEDKIQAAKDKLAQIKAEEADRAEAAKVDALINAIGTVTLNSEEAIVAAENAWEALTKVQQGYVTKYTTLTKAREDYDTLVANRALAVEIEEKIKAIPESITNENAEDARALIKTARDAYDTASNAVRALVESDVCKLLTDAETELENVDKAEAARVDALILAIGTVTLDSKQAILDARSSLDALSDAQKKHVENEDVLTKAEKDYNTLSGYKQEAEELEKSITALSELGAIGRSNAETARDKINSVRVSYEGAGEAIQNFVSEDILKILTDAEDEIALVESAIKEAEDVEELIGGIGEITLDSVTASEEKLDEIAEKLETISDKAKGYIYTDKMTAYTEACNTLADFKAKLSQVQDVIDLITALGDVKDITLEDKEAIEDAEAAYRALGDLELQNRVENAQTLFAIRTKLDALIESKSKVDNVISLIESIGEVKLDTESKAKIEKARGAYDALTDGEKESVNNYTALTAAEALYNELYKAAAQEEKDQTAANTVIKLIEDIGTVELTSNCEALIIAAENAYKALENDRQIELVGSHYDTLVQARITYNALKADKEAVDKVIKAINDIGPVIYDEDCLARIQAAEKAYGDLRGDLKSQVTNADIIDFSKEKYAQLEAEDEAVKNVISLIDAVGEVSWTNESLEKIETARKAYNALRDDLKAKVENADILTEAEKTYESLKPVFKQKQSVEAYNGSHMTVITNVPEDMTVSDGDCDAVLVKIGEKVYHVFVTNHAVAEADIVLRHGAPAVHELGNINGQGGITALDALMACQYAARTEEAIKEFAKDSLAFIRADVNGSGTITALDALMIANKAAGEEVEFNLLIGTQQN